MELIACLKTTCTIATTKKMIKTFLASKDKKDKTIDNPDSATKFYDNVVVNLGYII